MSQAIALPRMISTILNQAGVPQTSAIVEKVIKDYAHEVAIVAIILSDNYMEQLYVGRGKGYMACIDELHDWAVEFVEKYAHVEEWEEFCNTQTEFENIMCWDDFVIAWGLRKLIKR